MILVKADKMFNIAPKKGCCISLRKKVVIFSKLSHSDSSTVSVKPSFKIKECTHDIITNNVKKEDFPKCFIQNLFINRFQEKVLEYPQLNFLEQVESLKKQFCLAIKSLESPDDSLSANKFYKSNIENPVNTLRTLELTGFKLPRHENGFGYVNSEYSFMQEALGLNPSLSKSVTVNDDFGIYLINNYGNDIQKEEYLKKLATGEIIASFAHLESEPFALLDPDLINTTAKLSSNKQNYVVSGKKNWVYNANYTDIFIISANITTETSNGIRETKPTLFIIPKKLPGIKIHEPIKTIALKNLNMCDVTFDEVTVPISSVLGKVQEGGTVIREILSNGKLSNGAYCLPIMRKLVNMAIKHCIDNKFFKKNKYEKDYYRIKVAQIVSQVYAVESMTYLLTGRLDKFKNPDLFLESLIVKIFASENLLSVLQGCMDIVGQEVITGENNWKEIIRDSQFYAASDITNDHLRLVLSITGVQYAMDHEKNKLLLTKLGSNTFLNALRVLPNGRDYKCVTKGILKGYVHSIFEYECRGLEDAVSWLSESTADLIKTYPHDVLERHWELKQLADMVIYIYAETAVLGRASRAYCLGVERSEVDRCIASALIKSYHSRINKLGRLLKYRQERPNIDKIDRKLITFSNYPETCSILNHLKIRN